MNLSGEVLKMWHSCGLSQSSFWLPAPRSFIIGWTIQCVAESVVRDMKERELEFVSELQNRSCIWTLACDLLSGKYKYSSNILRTSKNIKSFLGQTFWSPTNTVVFLTSCKRRSWIQLVRNSILAKTFWILDKMCTYYLGACVIYMQMQFLTHFYKQIKCYLLIMTNQFLIWSFHFSNERLCWRWKSLRWVTPLTSADWDQTCAGFRF